MRSIISQSNKQSGILVTTWWRLFLPPLLLPVILTLLSSCFPCWDCSMLNINASAYLNHSDAIYALSNIRCTLSYFAASTLFITTCLILQLFFVLRNHHEQRRVFWLALHFGCCVELLVEKKQLNFQLIRVFLTHRCRATIRRHEGWDTVRLPRPRQERLVGPDGVRIRVFRLGHRE